MTAPDGHRFRPYRPEDRDDFVRLFTDANVMRYVGDGVLTNARAEQLFERIFEVGARDLDFFIWAVEIDGAYAGHAELKRRDGKPDHELVYALAERLWRRGHGRAVAAEIVAFAFRGPGLAHVIATVDEANAPSRRIIESLGFRADERLRREYGAGAAYRLDAPALTPSLRARSSDS